MEELNKDVLGIILGHLSNEDIMRLKSTSWMMYRKLLKYKPEIEYSTIVHWRISCSDPNKEAAFEIKHVKSKDLRKIITQWGQEIIDSYKGEIWNDGCCKTEYSDFCYDCRLDKNNQDLSDPNSLYGCDKHNNKHLFLTNECYDAKLGKKLV